VGRTSVSFDVTINNDHILEEIEDFDLRIGQITSSISNVFAGESSQATVSIVDNDCKSLCIILLYH